MAWRAFKTANLNERDLSTPGFLLRALNTLQSNVAEVFAPMIAASQNDSQILVGVVLAPGIVNVVSHKLGRKLAGWKIVRLRANALVWDEQDANKQPDRTLLLGMAPNDLGTNVTVDLEVF